MNRPEQQIHKTIVQGLRMLLPHGWIIAHAPNGGKRTAVEGAIFKAMGVVPGFPDLMILGRADERAPHHTPATTWFMEVKAPKGRLTDVQLACHDNLRDLGFAVEVVKSWEDALEQCRQWGLPLKRTFP